MLERDERGTLSNPMLAAIASAIHALEVSRDASGHLIAVERAIRRHLEQTAQP